MNFYLSPNGNDASDGQSQTRAWQTLKRASEHAFKPGDKLLLQGGATFNGTLQLSSDDAGTPEKPVVIASFGRGRATINAGIETGISARNVGGIEVRDLRVIGDGAKINTGDGVRFFCDLTGGVKLRHVRVENVEASGFGGKRGTHQGGNGIVVMAWPEDKSASGFQDVRITNCRAHGNRMNGITVVGYDAPKSPTPGFAYSHADVLIEGCKTWENAGDSTYKENWSGNGIFVADVEGARIDNCEAWRNGYECGGTTGGPVGIWTAASNRVTIQNCHSHHNGTGSTFDGGGFDFDGGVTNSLMQNNLSHDNDGAGFLIYEWDGAQYEFARNVVRNNVSINDGRKNGYTGIYIASHDRKGVRSCAILNNTVIMSPAPSGTPAAIYVDLNVRDVLIANNLFVTRGDVPLFRGNASLEKSRFIGNAYFAETPKFESQASLPSWREATGQERDGERETGFFGDPQLQTSDAMREMARLAASSPLRDRGANVTAELARLGLPDAAPTHDFYGVVRSASAFTPGASN